MDQIKTAITCVKALNGQPANVILAGDSAKEMVPLHDISKLLPDVLTVYVFLLSNPLLTCSHNSHPNPCWPPPNNWTYLQLDTHSGTSWVSYDCVQFASGKLNVVVFGPLLTSLLTSLIPIVIGLVAALIPLVSSLLTSISGLNSTLGLSGLVAALRIKLVL
jgi:hypothetical protein